MSPTRTTTLVAIAIIVAIIAGMVGYFAGTSSASPVTTTVTTTYTVTTTISGAGATATVTQTVTRGVTETVTTTRTVTETVTAAAKPEYELHVAWLTAPNPLDTHTFFFKRFKELVEYRTGGRVKIIEHPGGELGDQDQYLVLMAQGQLFMATIEVSRFAKYTNKLNFLSFPGLFRSTQEAMAFAESEWLLDYSNSVLNEFGWVVLGITVGGARYFLSIPEKPITGLDSFKGLVLRVMASPPYIEAAKVLGANPQTYPYGECYTLLQTKTIDAMENEVAAIIAMRFYEVAPNIALIPWAYAWHFVVASKKVLDSLPQDIRQIIIDTAREVSSWKNSWGLFVEQVIGLRYLMEQGAKIISVDTKPIFDKLESEFLPKVKDQIPQGALEWLKEYRQSLA